MKRTAAVAIASVALCACGSDGSPPSDAAAPARELTVNEVGFDGRGISDAITFEVPAGTRSLTIIARGQIETLYGLAELTTADGIERVGLETTEGLAEAMQTAYFDEQVGSMPSAMYQSVRLGLFPHVYPNRPGDPLPAGPTTVRIAAADPSGLIDVTLLMPPDDGAQVLPLNVFAVSNELTYDTDPAALPFLPTLSSILDQAGITVAVDQIVNLPDTGLSDMTELTEPQEPPTSMSSELALLAGALVEGDALNVFVVDSLPSGVAGWSLGTPGPPLPDTYYSGVVAANYANQTELGRVLAHEIAHYVGLSHVVNRGVSGAIYEDPLDDTTPGSGNLMEGGGTTLTADQSFVLLRSALLR